MGIVKRSDKVSFYGVKSAGTTTYKRMKGFTEISKSKNAVEYTRQYVDMPFEESDVVGYAPSISIGFDQHTGNDVHTDIADIFDSEKSGEDGVREIIVVDFTQAADSPANTYAARKRSYAVIPDGEGSNLDRYDYTATLKAKSESAEGTATSTDNWLTCTFTAKE